MAARGKLIVRLGAVVIALALALLCGCGGGDGVDHGTLSDNVASDIPEEGYVTMQLFDDIGYERGFTVMGQDTVKKGNVLLGGSDIPDEGQDPAWMIAQWNSGPCLYRDRVESAPNVLTDGSIKTVTLDPETRAVALRLNTIPYYNGAPGKTENWPHLLLEQSPLVIDGEEALKFYSCSADKLIVSLDIRMNSYRFVDIDGVNAAQFLSYYYIKSKTGDDFVWFGVPLFDNRGETGLYWALDTAGSNRMIYSIPSTETYKNSVHSFLKAPNDPRTGQEWVHVEVDLKPHLEALLALGLQEGIFKYAKTLDDLYISGVNIGWETIGSFDIEMEIKNFSLLSYICVN
ncbi:MAG: hypothetical protein J6X19_07215 [Clostridia bacterium]|nr:hypothetical protein [Clostridia bacterium]